MQRTVAVSRMHTMNGMHTTTVLATSSLVMHHTTTPLNGWSVLRMVPSGGAAGALHNYVLQLRYSPCTQTAVVNSNSCTLLCTHYAYSVGCTEGTTCILSCATSAVRSTLLRAHSTSSAYASCHTSCWSASNTTCSVYHVRCCITCCRYTLLPNTTSACGCITIAPAAVLHTRQGL